MGDTYVDLEVLAEVADDDYLIKINKADLNTLVTFSEGLIIRHWDGNQPVSLEGYGESAVRTTEDATESNNLAQLPKVGGPRIAALLKDL
jgi:hypothetical protein